MEGTDGRPREIVPDTRRRARGADDDARVGRWMVLCLWLLPSRGSEPSIAQQIATLARQHSAPTFAPHITLIGDVAADRTSELSQLAGTGAVTVQFAAIDSGNSDDGQTPWNQACVAVCDESAALLRLKRHADRAFSLSAGASLGVEAVAEAPVQWAPPLRRPHMSLVYADNLSADQLSEVEPPTAIECDTVAIWDCTPATLDGVARWREVSRVQL